MKHQLSFLLVLLMFCFATIGESWIPSADAQNEPRPKVRGKKYRVTIDSQPQQAAIYLDDEKYGIVGYTPWSGRLVAGNVVVILKKEGFAVASQPFVVAKQGRRQSFTMAIEEEKKPGSVNILADSESGSAGSDVWIDGINTGTVPLLSELPAGRYLFEIRKDGYETFHQWVDVGEGEKVTLSPLLTKVAVAEVGSLLVNADVADAIVTIDGKEQSETAPLVISGISAGPHVVEVRKGEDMQWRQVVEVETGKTVKVLASLVGTRAAKVGNIRVLSNIAQAEVIFDGVKKGKVPLTLEADVGEHLIEVKAPGHLSEEQRVTVTAGKDTLIKLDLVAGEPKPPMGTIRVVSSTSNAEVFIDGKNIGEVPQVRELTPGDHFVVISKEGYKAHQVRIKVTADRESTVSTQLEEVGLARILSKPSGAEVLLDGVVVGTTPITKLEIAAGEHVLALRLDGYLEVSQDLEVAGGTPHMINLTLKAIDSAPTVAELEHEQRSLTTWSARALPAGRTTIDAFSGYPYYMGGGLQVGAGRIKNFSFDTGVSLRSYFVRTDLMVKGRVTFYDKIPFAFGAFAQVGGGSDLVGSSGRNSVSTDLGLTASLTSLDAVTISFQAYLNLWSDRHCPTRNFSGSFEGGAEPSKTCRDYASGALDNTKAKERIDDAVGGTEQLFNRDNGARLMTALIVEYAVHQKWNIWGHFESNLFQSPRAAFLGDLYGPMFVNDSRRYLRLGATYKY